MIRRLSFGYRLSSSALCLAVFGSLLRPARLCRYHPLGVRLRCRQPGGLTQLPILLFQRVNPRQMVSTLLGELPQQVAHGFWRVGPEFLRQGQSGFAHRAGFQSRRFAFGELVLQAFDFGLERGLRGFRRTRSFAFSRRRGFGGGHCFAEATIGPGELQITECKDANQNNGEHAELDHHHQLPFHGCGHLCRQRVSEV